MNRSPDRIFDNAVGAEELCARNASSNEYNEVSLNRKCSWLSKDGIAFDHETALGALLNNCKKEPNGI